MKKGIMILLFTFLTIISFSQEFIGIKVDGNINDVVEKFKGKGLKVSNRNSTPNVISMEGIVGNRNLELNIVCTPTTKIVWKFAVYLPKQTLWTSLESEYEEYLDLLTKKYGEPEKKYNFFSSPYEDGDGYEMTAVAVEKCTYAAFWPENLGLFIEISKWKQVKINYENITNSAIARKEEAEIKNKIF
jgi:hypothetical protein